MTMKKSLRIGKTSSRTSKRRRKRMKRSWIYILN
jgi:hypothetical protein